MSDIEQFFAITGGPGSEKSCTHLFNDGKHIASRAICVSPRV
jgi:hypothetical protein